MFIIKRNRGENGAVLEGLEREIEQMAAPPGAACLLPARDVGFACATRHRDVRSTKTSKQDVAMLRLVKFSDKGCAGIVILSFSSFLFHLARRRRF